MTYIIESTHCDGSSNDVLNTASCTIPAQTLNDAPYSLAWGTEVFAKVFASNIYGDTAHSAEGGGGTIVRIPDKPESFAEVVSDRTPTTLGMSWIDGSENGGLSVIDY